jgi:ParB/RepB/Spo0J family partition protein
VKESLDYVMLRDSIRKDGILHNLVVRQAGDMYEVILGSHRYEIARDLGIPVVTCKVIEADDAEAERLQVVENKCRVETKPSEYARRIQKMLHQTGMSIPEIAASICRHPDTVKKWLNLNFLAPECKKALDSGQISGILGIELAKLPLTKQTELLSLHNQFTSQEYLELLRQQVREYRGQARIERGRQKAGTQPTFRQFRKVKDEYLTPTEAATVLTRKEARTALDGWKAALEWVLSMDESTVQERVARSERQKALENKRTELLNLESKERPE